MRLLPMHTVLPVFSFFEDHTMPFHTEPKAVDYTALPTEPESRQDDNDSESPSGCGKAHIVSFTARELAVYFGAWVIATLALFVTLAIWLPSSRGFRDLPLQKGEYGKIVAISLHHQSQLLSAPAKDAISVNQVLFVASATFNKSASPPRQFRQDGPRYVGDPSPDIDKAWDALLDDQYFYITDEEAKIAWGDALEGYWRDDARGGYRAG